MYCTCDFNQFSLNIGRGATPLLDDITPLLPSMSDHRLKLYFIVELLSSLRYHSISEPEILIAQAINHLKHYNDPELEFKFHRALVRYYSEHTHDIPKAVKHCQTALFLAQENGDYRGQCIAIHKFSWIEWLRGNYTAGRAYAQEVQKLVKISGDLFQEAQSLYTEALCWKVLGYYKYCISQSTRARTLLALCGMSYGDLNYSLMNSQAEVHKYKSEYIEAYNIQNQILQKMLEVHNDYRVGFTLINIAEIEVFMGVSKDLIQEKINASQAIIRGSRSQPQRGGYVKLVVLPMPQSRLGQVLTVKERLGVHKALQFLGDVFLKENDEATAISLFTLALEGFTQMDVHQSRAECMTRLGDISKKNGDLLRALELWEMARPLFEQSSQVKRVEDVDERLGGIAEEMKEQHRVNLTRLAELNAPVGKVEEVEDDSSEDKLERENIGSVVTA
ncbi:hypothetical protein B0H16DRAFT_1476526 [Mycena metata]|uniref:Uncharacterized protein n=1 Tax=Mycena metata TaxID=1033252 RepID=A0AAD7HC82_9AGAR|nr:hypothetical protein B0H16DRAFT_1476526 [Mycena metata]